MLRLLGVKTLFMYHFDDPHSRHNINNILILVVMDGAVKFPFYRHPPIHPVSQKEVLLLGCIIISTDVIELNTAIITIIMICLIILIIITMTVVRRILAVRSDYSDQLATQTLLRDS